MKNVWQAISGTRFVQVYAGAMTDDPSQGVVVVHNNSFDFSSVIVSEFKTPTRHGSLKVEAEKNNVLTLRADDGTAFFFDENKFAFVPKQD